ncbi:hypothetical protein [Brachybacterium sp. GPGPB12]|uniref:hypothetical protein n=1 Tax=Brachybacterium sp. GPGPB12 TaxID=3023517 RepID=UPI0031343CDC
MKRIKHHLINHLPFGRLALVALKDGQPARGVFQPISATQLIGGSSWSLSLIRLGPHQNQEHDDE